MTVGPADIISDQCDLKSCRNLAWFLVWFQWFLTDSCLSNDILRTCTGIVVKFDSWFQNCIDFANDSTWFLETLMWFRMMAGPSHLIWPVLLATQLGTYSKFVPKQKATMISCMDQVLVTMQVAMWSIALRLGALTLQVITSIDVPVWNRIWPRKTS